MKEHLTVGRLAELAGVTVRTLHHYDEIGLVRPSARTAGGYRAYSAGDVERLREVLAYRRLDFGLREIADLVADAVAHLHRLRGLLLEQRDRADAMVAAIDREFTARGKGMAVTPEEQLGMFGARLYDAIGGAYPATRRTDPRIAAQVWDALGDARTVLNVGAGTGSYEPPGRDVTAVEPSAVMRALRPEGSPPCVAAAAESLPFADQSFDAAMAFSTVPHWHDPVAGLREMRRVARRVVVFTFDATEFAWRRRFWLTRDYLPEAAPLTDPGWLPRLADAIGGRRRGRRAALQRRRPERPPERESPYGGIHAGKWPVRVNPDDVRHAWFQEPADGSWHQLDWEHAAGLGTPFSAEAALHARRLAARQGGWPDQARALDELLARWEQGNVAGRRERRMAAGLAAERTTLPAVPGTPGPRPEPDADSPQAGRPRELRLLPGPGGGELPAAAGDDDDPAEIFTALSAQAGPAWQSWLAQRQPARDVPPPGALLTGIAAVLVMPVIRPGDTEAIGEIRARMPQGTTPAARGPRR